MVRRLDTAAALASYDRCREAPEFFPTFYQKFLEACPEASAMFAGTDFDRQNRLLRHAIGLLLTFPNQPRSEPTTLGRLAERHSRRDLNVHPSLYRPFIESLIATVREYDAEFNPEVEAAWRATLALGIEYMQSRY